MNKKIQATAFADLASASVDYGTSVTDGGEFLAICEASFNDGKLVLPSNVVPGTTRDGQLVRHGKFGAFIRLIKVENGNYAGVYGNLNAVQFKD